MNLYHQKTLYLYKSTLSDTPPLAPYGHGQTHLHILGVDMRYEESIT